MNLITKWLTNRTKVTHQPRSAKQKEYSLIQKNKRRERNRRHLWNILLLGSCIDCGETHPLTLEFDHVGDNKQQNISYMVSRGYGLETLNKEIKKCEIVCSNCHAKRYHAKRSTYRYQYWSEEQ